MSIKSKVKEFLRDEVVFPNKTVVVGECLDTDNSTYEAHFTKTEYELIMLLKLSNIKGSTLDKLTTLIEDYGQEKWEEGNDEGNRQCD
jgi:hypothetical protein